MRPFVWHRPRFSPIAVDMGHAQIRLLQLFDAGRGEVACRHLAVWRLDALGQQDLAGAVRQMLISGRFSGRRAVSCIPNAMLKVTSVRLADDGRVQKEAACRFGLDPSQYCIRFLKAGTIQQAGQVRDEVIVFAASQDKVDSHVRLLDRAGLEVVGLEPAACALARVLCPGQADQGLSEAVLDVGHSSTTLIIAQQGQIRLAKVIPYGVEGLCAAIADRLDVDRAKAKAVYQAWQCQSNGNTDGAVFEAAEDVLGPMVEDLANQVMRCLRYYAVTFRGQRVGHVFLSGGGGNKRIVQQLAARCHCPVRMLEPGVRVGRGLPLPGSEWAVAVGLAARGWGQQSASKAALAAGA